MADRRDDTAEALINLEDRLPERAERLHNGTTLLPDSSMLFSDGTPLLGIGGAQRTTQPSPFHRQPDNEAPVNIASLFSAMTSMMNQNNTSIQAAVRNQASASLY